MSEPPGGIGRGGGGRGAALLRLKAQRDREKLAAASSGSEAGPSTPSSVLSTSAPAPFVGRGFALPSRTPPSSVPTPSRTGSLSSFEASRSIVEESEDVTSAAAAGVQRVSLTPSTSSSHVSSRNRQDIQIEKQRGQSGDHISLMVNHIPIRIKKGKGLFEYAVMFSVDVSRSFSFKLLGQHREIIGPTKTFDGSKLYLPSKLEQPSLVLDGVHPVDGTPVQITLKFIREHKMSECIHHFNVLIRRVMNFMNLVQIGRNMYNPAGSIDIRGHDMELWPGFVTSIQEFEGGLMLLAEVSHRVVRTQTVLDVMSDIQRNSSSHYKEECMRQLIGTCILTRYNNRTYRINDIAWNMNPASTFTSAKGEEIVYIDYYKRMYDIDIRNLGQPMLIHIERAKKDKNTGIMSNEKKLCLVPELCYATGLTDTMRSNFSVMKDLGMHTRITPDARRFVLKKFVDDIYKCDKAREVLDGWGIEIMPEMLESSGRILKAEDIFVGNRKTICGSRQADWSRRVVQMPVLSAVNLADWAVLFVKRNEQAVHNFIETAQKVSDQMGIQVKYPNIVMLPDERLETLNKCLRRAITNQLQMMVVVNPTSRDDRYNLIKKLCCIDCPVPSQVINSRTIDNDKKLRSVTQKIMLQMNCKLGGELWSVDIPLSKLMVIGIDAYHDTPLGNRSSTGFVSSTNPALTRWYSQCGFQTHGEELGNVIKSSTIFALQRYFEINHYMPEKIIVFRDGVGDGQLEHVSVYEVEQILSAFKSYSDNYTPFLTFIVVQKRINTRLLALDRGRLDNPPPGTVLDHTVTRKNWFDFFLVSQHVGQGTVTPTHYVVLFNNNESFKPDYIQRITYKMTHLYYNWPGTIRVPAPCQYAHKLAAQVGMNLKAAPSPVLSDRLFFL